jgi:hypothetical protein
VTYEVSADSDGIVTITVAGEPDIRAVPALESERTGDHGGPRMPSTARLRRTDGARELR